MASGGRMADSVLGEVWLTARHLGAVSLEMGPCAPRSPCGTENGRSPAGGAGLLYLNPVDGGSTFRVLSSGTWGVYRFDRCACEYTHMGRHLASRTRRCSLSSGQMAERSEG